MYLVLTAMLALNVSADILNGFTKLRHSMESSMRATEHRTIDVLQNFKMQAEENKKFEEWYAVASAVVEKSDEFYNYIENFKLDIARMEDGIDYQPGQLDTLKLKNGSDTNKPHQYALTERGESGKFHAEEFKDIMTEYRDFMTSADSRCIVEKMGRDHNFRDAWNQKINMFAELFSTNSVRDEEGNLLTWEESTFHEMPADAVIALLTKYQNDIRMAENDIVQFMYQQGGSSDFVVNSVTAFPIPTNGEYILQGHQYRAKIASVMIDTTQQPRVFIGGVEIPDGVYVTSGHIGENKYNGYMLVGEDTTRYPFEGQFTVGAPQATIANTECNVLYRSYANKMSISVPGVSSDALTVSCPRATVTKVGGGEWTITLGKDVKKEDLVTITVTANVDGSNQSMGAQTFTAKDLPAPNAYLSVNGKPLYQSVPVPRVALASSTIIADNVDAVIKVDWRIKSYQVKCHRKTFNSIAQVASVAQDGDIIKVTKIQAEGPGGQTRFLNDLAIEIQ